MNGNEKARQNQELQSEYVKTLNRIREQIKKLERTMASEPAIARSWTHVGTLYEIQNRLEEMNEWLNGEGEYANTEPVSKNPRLEIK